MACGGQMGCASCADCAQLGEPLLLDDAIVDAERETVNGAADRLAGDITSQLAPAPGNLAFDFALWYAEWKRFYASTMPSSLPGGIPPWVVVPVPLLLNRPLRDIYDRTLAYHQQLIEWRAQAKAHGIKLTGPELAPPPEGSGTEAGKTIRTVAVAGVAIVGCLALVYVLSKLD